MQSSFKTFEVSEQNGSYSGSIREKMISELPENEVLVKVSYSGLNYKDALSASGHKGVTRRYPHTPGIDAAGIVTKSKSQLFKPGDEVIVTSYDLGMNTPGGFGQLISVPSGWLVSLPADLSLRESMIFGTAGLTAAQGILSMMNNSQDSDQGPILVTGARGAVGSMAIMILSKLGFDVIAGVSQLGDDTEYLKSLGAIDVVDSKTTSDSSGRVMLASRWAGAFDTIGGNTLATILKSTSYGGNVVCVGNIESFELSTTVFPFILNGVNLLGIGTQDTKMETRNQIWGLLADKWKPESLDKVVTEIGLSDLARHLEIMSSKKSRGRVLLNLDKE